MIIQGFIQQYDGQNLTIIAPFSDEMTMQRQGITECEVRLDDGRTISADQRKKIYATLKEIAEWSGHLPEEVKELLKYDYIAQTGAEWFSLSDCDMTTANLYLTHIIEFCVLWGIPCADSLLDRSPDISRYVYACLIHKKCALCGEKAELHHVDSVGSGRNRKEIVHVGMEVMPLCRKHHNEAHSIGKVTFSERYKIHGITIDPYLAKVLKLKGK